MNRKWIGLILLPLGALLAWRSSAASFTLSPGTLTYVESSVGLDQPQMEGGRTELEMGDVNGDGNPDLVSIGDHGSPFINSDEHGVMVWFGDGDGTWSLFQNGNFGYGGVALGDANADGWMDVGYGMHHNYSDDDFGDQLLEVALGDGSGQSWTPWDDGLATHGETYGMFGSDFADVDNDGDLDLGSISFGCCAGVHVYLNLGDGSWDQSFGVLGGNSQMHFAFGDVNADGNTDFAVSYQHGAVYLGDGSGGFDLEHGNLPANMLDGVSLGDVDHDGRADLSFCNSSGGIEVWGWVAPDTWQDLSGDLPASGTCAATQLADMDMDGHLDVVGYGGRQVRVWGGDGVGGWEQIAVFQNPSNPGEMAAFRVGGDADHNGYPDIAIIASEGGGFNDRNHTRFFKEATPPTELAIQPVFPRGGETFRAGGVVFVDWHSAVPGSEPALVSLELSTSGSAGPWTPVAGDLPDGGRYQWRIPPDLITSTDAYIRYTLSLTETVEALTPAAFTVLGQPEEPITGLQAANDSPTPLGEATNFTSTVASGSNVAYHWDFGDGQSGEGPAVEHIYPAVGLFTATVTATNSVSSLTATTPVTITDQSVAGLLALNSSPTTLGQPTLFTATLTAGTNVVFTWDFGDGLSDSGATISHVYPLPGAYTTLVTAQNSVSSLTATTPVSITFELGDLIPPEVLATQPISGAGEVAIDVALVITFSEPISASTFVLSLLPDPGGWVEAWSEDGAAVVLTHAPFDYATTYTAAVTAADLGGNPLPEPYQWGFTTQRRKVLVYLPVVGK